MLAVDTAEGPVVLARCEGRICAFQDRCSHQNFPLSGGELDDCEVECPFHGAVFDIRTGEALALPAAAPIAVYQVRVQEGRVLLKR